METFTRIQFRDRYPTVAEQALFGADHKDKLCQHFIQVEITEEAIDRFIAELDNYKGRCFCFSWQEKHVLSPAIFGFEFKEDLYIFTLKYQYA